MFPPLPAWDGIHPLIVHFPIALLITAPGFVVLGLLFPRAAKCWQLAALCLMFLGAVGAWFAVASGGAGGKLADGSDGFRAILEKHEELAELARNVFTALTAVFALLVLLPMLLHKELKAVLRVGLHVAFLLVYLGCELILLNAAHNGGRLVHEFGVRAMIEASSSSSK